MLLKIIKGVWLFTCVAVLFVSLYYFSPGPKNDIEVFLIWSMIFLTFPIGYVVTAIFTLIAILLVEIADVTLQTSYLLILINWLAFFIAGYLQWFVWVPKLVKWIKNKKMKPLVK